MHSAVRSIPRNKVFLHILRLQLTARMKATISSLYRHVLHLLLLPVLIQALSGIRAEAPADGLPYFVEPVDNVTVSIGREAKLTCVVENLSDYKVAWIHTGSGGRTVLSVATQVITKNPRVSATQEGATSWVLTITNITQKDRGTYMCQVNTRPNRKQIRFLVVVEPPAIDDESSSGDIKAKEGDRVLMTCEAKGDPQPTIRWVREDGGKIAINDTDKVAEYTGKSLLLPSVTRRSAGVFFCIASNGVPPAVSKRIFLDVHFAPRILSRSSGGVLTAFEGGEASLACDYEMWPPGKVEWYRGLQKLTVSPPNISISLAAKKDPHRWTSVLTLRDLQGSEFTTYRCLVSNPMGKAEDTLKLMEITTTTSSTTSTTTTTTTTTTTSTTPRPVRKATQPPYVPWWTLNEADTTTAVSVNHLVQEEQETSREGGAASSRRGGGGQSGKDGASEGAYAIESYYGSSAVGSVDTRATGIFLLPLLLLQLLHRVLQQQQQHLPRHLFSI